jgi:hypothetical protein
LRAPAIRSLVEAGVIYQLSLFDKRDLAEIAAPDYPGERLVACRNPMLANERARKRGELLDATEKKADRHFRMASSPRAPLGLRGLTPAASNRGPPCDRRLNVAQQWRSGA